MLRLLLLPLAASITLLSAASETPVSTNATVLASVATLHSGIQFAGETVDGDFSALIPLHSTLGEGGLLGGTLIFAEPYAQWMERGNVQAGIGLGVRHLFNQQPVAALRSSEPAGFLSEGFYVGAGASLDMVDTHYDQRFWQLGLGAEIGTRYLELRGRYHIPLDDGEQSQFHRRQVINGSRSQPYDGARIQTDYTLTVNTLFTFLTESLEGWDLDASVQVPGLDCWVDLRLIGGYSHYEGRALSQISYGSWKAGVEFRPVPAVVLSGMWLENERLVGDHWLFGIGVEIPLETAAIDDGKGGFWGHLKEAFKPRHRHLQERLAEPSRDHTLPMQIGSGFTGIKSTTTLKQRSALILPDGRVLAAVSSSSTKSGSAAAASTSSAGIEILGGTLALTKSGSGTAEATFVVGSDYSGTLIFNDGTSVIHNSDSAGSNYSPADYNADGIYIGAGTVSETIGSLNTGGLSSFYSSSMYWQTPANTGTGSAPP